jgi:hypothetical protein
MKIFLLFLVNLIVVGCLHHSPKASLHYTHEEIDSLYPHIEVETMEERDSALRDWPFPGANGDWIPCRDGLENCDTIVDGHPYNHV